jgi:polysaccharide chain length determinant protein (PEP-CTERM system associated)
MPSPTTVYGAMNLQELIAEVLEHLRGMWRYRWWTLGAAWGVSVLGSVYVFTLPDVYQASARVFVDTNSLLKPLMQGLTAASNTMNEVQLVSSAVLTRPNLEEVAHETDLMLRARTPEQVEKLITELQERIKISGGLDNIFSIQYEDMSREKARDVVAAVLDTFVESTIGNEGDDAELTERAVATEIEVHESRLRAAEAALASFKQQNLGYMPGETGDYYNRLQLALGKAAASEEELRVLSERRDELQRQIDGEEPVFGIVPSPTGSTGARCRQSAHIAQIETQLAQLRVEFTDKHPRVVSLQETIAQLNEECRAELAAANAAGLFAPRDPAQPLEANPVYQNLRIQLSSAEVEIAEVRAHLNAEQGEIERLRRDVDKITQVETELKQLNRDYDVVQGRHQELLKRWEDLQAKKRLDPVTDDVQFRRIEPPFALADPVGPNRPLLLGIVLFFALGAGAALAFALNQVNPTFFTRASLRGASSFPVLGAISMILTPEAISRRRVDRLVWVLGVLALFVWTVASVTRARQASTFVQAVIAGVVA